jgi:hypothetical protein
VAAIEETAYPLDVLKLNSVAIDASSDSKYLRDAYYDPWLEELNRRKTTLIRSPQRLASGFWSRCLVGGP